MVLLKAGPHSRHPTCVIMMHILNNTKERSHCVFLTRTEAQCGSGWECSASVLRPIFQKLLFSEVTQRIQRTVLEKLLFGNWHTRWCRVVGCSGSSYVTSRSQELFVLQDGLPFQWVELSSPKPASVSGSLSHSWRASGVLKLCRIQGKSRLGQSLCSYPSGSFQGYVGTVSIIFVWEELAKSQCALSPAQAVDKKTQRLLQWKEEKLLKRNCLE